MLTVPVTCTASDQNGNPVAGAVITAKLNQTEIYLGHIVPESITATADANGVAVLNLWPNALGVNGSMYRVTATNPDTGRKYLDAMVSVPNSACNLHQITTTEPYPAIDASAQALAAAQGALALVTAQAGIATTKAGEASTSAGNAATSATNAASSATAASGSASAAAGSASIASVFSATSENMAAAAASSAANAESSAATATTQAGIATTQAGLATTNGQAQVTLATTQANNAATSAGTATTQAGNASTSANAANNAATNSGNSASASASSATASAASAVTAANQATNSATSATASANSAAATLAIYGSTTAVQNAVAASALNATQVATVNSVATTQASAAAASALSASASRDQSIAAWAAATVPGETLTAISQSIHAGAIVKSIIYDTSKDSDGGAWRKRCTDKSWFTETLGGNRWIGQRSSVGAAWTAAGSTAGAVYQSTADGKYYSPTSATVQTEVFRGIAREFPEQVSIVAEAGRVVIYDLTVPGCPMWMVFLATSSNRWWGTGAAISSLSVVNGSLTVAAATDGTRPVNFIADTMGIGYSIPVTAPVGGIAGRNSTPLWAGARSYSIVNATVKDIAVTVLEGAPIDPSTGLATPTIAVATDGGVSVIKHDGTVVNSLAINVSAIGIDSLGYIWFGQSSNGNYAQVSAVPISQVQANWTHTVYRTSNLLPELYYGNIKETKVGKGVVSLGGSLGFSTLKPNPNTPAKGMVAAITNAYNSGWQVGDSRGAWLSDTVAETIAAPELVTNGGFATDTTGWVPTNATLAVVGGELQVTSLAAGNTAGIFTILGLTVGGMYRFTRSFRRGTAPAPALSDVGGIITTISTNATTVQTPSTHIFTATATGHTVTAYFVATAAGETIFADDFSVKRLDADRSVKSNGLSIVGSLTKTAVAAGAQLVAYSGFSAANYLEQPYSANLDFGTGDFCVMGWHKQSAIGALEYILNRDNVVLGRSIRVFVNATGYLVFKLYDGTTTRTALGTSLLPTGWNCIVCTYVAGTLNVYVNAALYISLTGAALLSLSDSAAILRMGNSVDGAFPATTTSLALWRTGATAPSADQIAQIYRDELPLFQPGAQCTIAGTSTAVTALAYDESTDLLHVGTSWGRSAFRGLLRTESEATTTGAITSLSAAQGAVLTGGTSAKIYQPALQLRDELARKEEAKRALGKVPVFIDITATASQTAFVLAKGYTIKALYRNGVLMRETTTGVFWTRSNDGYQETATLSVGATVGDWISLMCVRSN